jgi:arylsulfatase A
MVAYVDKTVGKLKAKLEELGIADNTVILFTGDNGTDKPVVTKMKDGTTIAGNKGSMKDGGTHVPLIAYSPALIQKGVVTDALVDFSDFLPTICDLTGVAKPENVDGRSFYPLLTGKPYKPRDWIYIWYSRSGFIDQAQEFTRNQRYKLYRTGDFFDIEKDLLEKNPIGEEKLLEKTRSVKIMLQAALDQYTDARPENLRKVTPAGKKKKANKKN